MPYCVKFIHCIGISRLCVFSHSTFYMIILSVWLCPSEWLSRLCGMFAITPFFIWQWYLSWLIVCLLSLLFCYDNIIHLHCQSVRFHVKSWLPARSIVLECLLSRGKIDPSGEIMVLDRFCPVKSWPFCVISKWISPISTTQFFGSVSKLKEAMNVTLVWLFYFTLFHVHDILWCLPEIMCSCCKNRHLKIVAPPKKENTWFVL